MSINMEDILNEYSIDMDEGNSQEGWLNIQCPFCDDELYHLGWNITDEYFHCWRCGFHSTISTVMEFAHISFKEAQTLLEGADDGYYQKNVGHFGQMGQELILPEGLFELSKEDSFHFEYLKKRKFTNPEKLIAKYKLWGTSYWTPGIWRYRIVIPVFFKKRLVSAIGRDISDREDLKKYVAVSKKKSIIPVKDVVFNFDNISGNKVVVCEGAFDVFKLGDGAVATLGIEFSPSQIEILKDFKKIFILFDSEKKAQERAKRLGDCLSAFCDSVDILELNGVKDAGELEESDGKKIMRKLGF